MAERIDVPPTLQGDEKAQLQQVWSYLYQLSEAINNNLAGIGGNELTDAERQTMRQIINAGKEQAEQGDIETLKSLIIKTADFVQTNLQEYRINLLGESVASGKFGKYVRHTGLNVAVNPEGIMQKYTFEEVVQGLKTYSINAKNYIKTGLLRTVNNEPVYGVAIGKDVVTFSEEGVETYNDGNKVAELTADELSFWQNGVKVAGYTGSRISFYYNGSEVFYIQNGKLYSVNDIELSAGKKVIMGEWEISDGGITHKKSNEPIGFEIARYADRDADMSGIYYLYEVTSGGYKIGQVLIAPAGEGSNSEQLRGLFIFGVQEAPGGGKMKYLRPYTGNDAYESYLGTSGGKFDYGYINYLFSQALMGNTSLLLYPKGNSNVYLAIYELDVSGNKIIQLNKGSGVNELQFVGNITGDVKGGVKVQFKTETNLNNYTEDGIYGVSMSSCTNKPSDISVGTGVLEVFRYSSLQIMQRMNFSNYFYQRSYLSGTWGSWYKFEGTAV